MTLEDSNNTIDALLKFIKKIGLPTNIYDLTGVNIDDSIIQELADGASANGTKTLGEIKALTREDMVEIYKAARK